MPQEQFGLETLQFVMSQFSDDIVRDCSKIISKVLDPLPDPRSNESVNLPERKDSKFAIIRALLALHEKLRLSTENVHSQLPLPLIIKSITYRLQCSNESCNLPDNDIQCDVLSIVSYLFCNELSQNSSKHLQELAEFYDHILTCADVNKVKKECASVCLIFKIKIISLIYEVLTNAMRNQTLFPSAVHFQKKLKLKKCSEEGSLFSCMILHDDKNIAIQTLMDLIPKHVNCFESDAIVKIIWDQISNSMDHSDTRLARVYITLCNFFNLCFDQSILKDKVDLALLLLEDANYWKLVQSALIDRDSMRRKQGLYLFKKTIDLLSSQSTNISCTKEKNILYWHEDLKEELHKIYSDIIIILEYFEEQQVHIIKPIFKMVETLMEKIFVCGKVDFSWILLVYQKALTHENSQVVKWGLGSLLKLPTDFYSHEMAAEKAAKLLVITLNNVNIYYRDGLTISDELKAFFERIARLVTAKTFFRLFVREICSQVWSAEALFFVTHSLSGIGNFPFWGQDEIHELKIFVSKAFKTHNKAIRTGVQRELLTVVLSLSDKDNLPLEGLIILLSKFPAGIVLRTDTVTWEILINWLSKSYSKEDVKYVLELYTNQMLGLEFNEKCMSLMLILFFYCDYHSDMKSDFSFIINHTINIFLSFKSINKRPYCITSLHDRYLSVIGCIYEANVNNTLRAFISPTLPLLNDVILYIQTRPRLISDLSDFNACQLHSKAFENIVKTIVLFDVGFVIVEDFYEVMVRELRLILSHNPDLSSVDFYYRLKFLSVVLRLYLRHERPDFLIEYLIKNISKPLKKESDFLGNTGDLPTLWGKINSEFIEEKWKIFECLISECRHSMSSWNLFDRIGSHNLCLMCTEALNAGSYGVLCPVMSVLKRVFPHLKDESEIRKTIDSVWKLIMERRKSEEFKSFLKEFVEMLFQKPLISKGGFMVEILLKYSDLIFTDSSLEVVNIFMKHIQTISNNMIVDSGNLFCRIIGKGLIFGSVQKKDERLINTVCFHIVSLNLCDVEEMGDSLSNEIRARAIQKILTLNKNNFRHQTFANNLITVLVQMEQEINKNRIRYYGDSYVHRVKHRLLQALLLLEPMLVHPNKFQKQVEELYDWVHRCLMKEDSQPSVRYMQEWLLVNILLRHSELYSRFSVNGSFSQFKEIKKKGLCSLFAVTFHLCQQCPDDLMEGKILCEMSAILPFCFHQHFEVRLYAQTVMFNLYQLAEKKNLSRVIEEYKTIINGLTECFSKELKGNFNTNLAKLCQNFYFSTFDPLEHYSLETIFVDLPKLANVSSDEWISTKTFKFCGVNPDKIDIPLTTRQGLSNNSCWPNYDKIDAEFENQKSEEIFRNYQKKMIPVKPLIPDWDDSYNEQNSVMKAGLIVVASLIDRIPNLGGLARTCEIFGASEYIINSLKYTEDKQFTSLSVTAEKWITIKEVKIQNLSDYILEMKQDGYVVIGAEQALYSQPLGSVKFPKKSLVLLGNEKEGIPPSLLPLLDVCVEIPQLGIIRSLNVHVTGALIIWEYAKQNHFS